MNEIIVGVIIVLILICIFICINSGPARSSEAMRGRGRGRGRGGHRGGWRGGGGWRGRVGHRGYGGGIGPYRRPGYSYGGYPADYGFYNLSYQMPYYVVEDPKLPGLVWCGDKACDVDETGVLSAKKADVAQCPFNYVDRGLKEYASGTFRRVCELST